MTNDESPKTVLLVDDDEDFLLQQKVHVQAAGYETVTATSRDEAEELIEQTRPDMAIIDLMMDNPDDGFVLCYHIKRKYDDVPVILVTSVKSATGMDFDASTDEERSWVKADAFISKPIRFEQLQREMERLLT